MYKTYQDLYFNLRNSDDVIFREYDDNKRLDITYNEFKYKVELLAKKLKIFGIKKGDRVAIMSNFKHNWLIFDFALQLRGAVSVSIYKTISKKDFEYNLKESNSKYIFLHDEALSNRYLSTSFKLGVKTIGISKNHDYNLNNITSKECLEVTNYIEDVSENDLCNIAYVYKSEYEIHGVKTTHKAFLKEILNISDTINLKEGDSVVSMLPISYFVERLAVNFYIYSGASIIFVDFSLDKSKRVNIIRSLDFISLTSTPSFFVQIYSDIKKSILLKDYISQKFLIYLLQKSSSKKLDKRSILYKLCHFLFYKDVKAIFKNSKYIFTIGDYMPYNISIFLDNCDIAIHNCFYLEEYMLLISINRKEDYRAGSIGRPVTGVVTKISDENELLIKSSFIDKNFNKNSEQNWIKTDKIADIIDNHIYIKGRKGDIFKDINGNYVELRLIEGKLRSNFFISDAIAVISNRPYITVIIFLNFSAIDEAKDVFLFNGSNDEFLVSSNLKDYVKKIISITNSSLSKYQKIHKFYISKKPLSISSGDITPLLKVKRKEIYDRYSSEIDDMYRKK